MLTQIRMNFFNFCMIGYIMATTSKTMQDKLVSALRSGKELTVAQVRAFGFANPYAAISTLRSNLKLSVYANQRSTRNGTVTKYRIGTPTKAMRKAGFTV